MGVVWNGDTPDWRPGFWVRYTFGVGSGLGFGLRLGLGLKLGKVFGGGGGVGVDGVLGLCHVVREGFLC